MEKNIMISYALCFVSFLLDSKASKKIDKIILFGSVARGNFDKESDIDIFVDSTEEIKNEVEKQLKLFKGSEIHRKWKLKGIKNEISLKCGKLEDWALKRDVLSDGITLYGKYKDVPKDAKYYLMIKLKFSKMERKQKIKIWRRLYGYAQKVGTKRYESRGLVSTLGGKKIEKSLVLVPMENRGEIIRYLNREKIDYEVREVWSDTL